MAGGAGKGDIASFATDVGAGKGGGVWVSLADAQGPRRRPRQALPLREPRRLGLRRHPDRQQAGQRDRRRPRRRPTCRRRRPRHAQRRPGHRRLQGRQGPHRLLRQGKAAESLGLRRSSTRPAAAAAACRSSAAAAPTTSPSPSTKPTETFGVSAPRRGSRSAPAARGRPAPDQVSCAAGGPGALADGRPRPRQRQPHGRRLAAGGRQRPPRRRPRQRHDPRRPRGRPDRGRPRRRQALRRRRLRRPGRRPARPDLPLRRRNGDLLAAGGGCAGGALVGGPGRDDASFAETQAHPGLLYVSFPEHNAWIDASRAATRSASPPPTRTWRAPSTTTS